MTSVTGSTGFLLGKFAPLHKGHQFLIETALAENDRVIVMIYHAPEVTSVPLPVRAGWIRALYPGVRVIEAWDGPMEIGDTPEIRKMHENYIRAALAGETVTNFYSGEFYGRHVSESLGARDRRVDPDRVKFPVSGTAVRENPFAHREFLDPVVYRDLVTRIVFLGAPSTGKTTLTAELARRHGTVWMPEYGREYWAEHQQDRRLTPEQLVEIAEGHRAREDDLIPRADRRIFIDTDATTTFIFADYYHGRAHPRLAELAADTLSRYDLFFLCEDDIPYDDTQDRSGEANRAIFQAKITADLIARRIPFIRLRGSLEERIARVTSIVRNFDRFDSAAEHLLRARPDDGEIHGARI